MSKTVYVIFLDKPLSREAVEQHVSYLRALDDADKLYYAARFQTTRAAW